MEGSKDFRGMRFGTRILPVSHVAGEASSPFSLSNELEGPRFGLTNFQGRLKTIFATIHNR
jgi:hypothetical protein